MAPRTKVPFKVAPHDATPLEFSELGLDSRLIAGIEDRGFVRTTPIQSAVYPIVSAGSDLIACAETGTGKTAAFPAADHAAAVGLAVGRDDSCPGPRPDA